MTLMTMVEGFEEWPPGQPIPYPSPFTSGFGAVGCSTTFDPHITGDRSLRYEHSLDPNWSGGSGSFGYGQKGFEQTVTLPPAHYDTLRDAWVGEDYQRYYPSYENDFVPACIQAFGSEQAALDYFNNQPGTEVTTTVPITYVSQRWLIRQGAGVAGFMTPLSVIVVPSAVIPEGNIDYSSRAGYTELGLRFNNTTNYQQPGDPYVANLEWYSTWDDPIDTGLTSVLEEWYGIEVTVEGAQVSMVAYNQNLQDICSHTYDLSADMGDSVGIFRTNHLLTDGSGEKQAAPYNTIPIGFSVYTYIDNIEWRYGVDEVPTVPVTKLKDVRRRFVG